MFFERTDKTKSLKYCAIAYEKLILTNYDRQKSTCCSFENRLGRKQAIKHNSMKKVKFSIALFLVGYLISVSACKANLTITPIVYAGSTPAHQYVRSLINIETTDSIDFIKWSLVMNDDNGANKTFVLSLNYGASQPNTTGFIGGGKKRTIQGTYVTSKGDDGMHNAAVIELSSSQFASLVSFVKVTENIIHLLTEENSLMVGGGDYSYSLNRETAVRTSGPLTSFVKTAFAQGDTSSTIILDARTPCAEVAKDHDLNVQPGCFKLKWKIILHKDPVSLQPTTYRIERTDRRTNAVSGNWSIVQDSKHPAAVIYRLDPTTPDFTIFLLVGDYNVLFMLDENMQPYKGNELHSYTLNRRIK